MKRGGGNVSTLTAKGFPDQQTVAFFFFLPMWNQLEFYKIPITNISYILSAELADRLAQNDLAYISSVTPAL